MSESVKSAVREVLETLVTPPPPGQNLQEVAAYSKRTKEMRDRMLSICRDPDAKGIVTTTEFDAVFKTVQDNFLGGTMTGSVAEAGFKGIEDALDEAEDRIAEHKQREAERLAALVEARGAFSEKVTGLRHRAQSLVAAKAATWDDFNAAFATIEGHFSKDELTGSAVDTDFGTLEHRIAELETAAKWKDAWPVRLKDVQDAFNVLSGHQFMPQGAMDTSRTCLTDAKALAGTGDFKGGLDKLGQAEKELGRARKLAEAEKDIFDNRDDLLEDVCTRAMSELNVSVEALTELLSDDQISELVRMERDAQKLSEAKRKVKRREIRKRYTEMKKLADEAAADVEEVAPEHVETADERLQRIDTLKKHYKSDAALLALEAEGEIYGSRLVFANRGANFMINGFPTPDYVSGYDVLLRNGPDGTQYRRMIVHFHFSDSAYSKLERAHFKDTHGGGDHSHVLVKTANQREVLAICKRHL